MRLSSTLSSARGAGIKSECALRVPDAPIRRNVKPCLIPPSRRPLPPRSPDPPVPPSSPASKSALMIVFLVVFIDLLGFGIVIPLLSRLRRKIREHADRRRQGGAPPRRNPRSAHGLVLGHAVLFRPRLGPHLRSRRPPADPAHRSGRLRRVLYPVRLRLGPALRNRNGQAWRWPCCSYLASARAWPAPPSPRRRRSSPTARRRSGASTAWP